jgi:hypothetical protein
MQRALSETKAAERSMVSKLETMSSSEAMMKILMRRVEELEQKLDVMSSVVLET